MTLTYEGNPARHSVLFCKKFSHTIGRLQRHFAPFKKKISIGDALLNQKWIRSVVDSHRVTMVATKGNGGGIVGLLSFSTLPRDVPRQIYAPHESLIYLQAAMSPGDMALVAAEHGDLFILLGNGIVFQRTQGRWHYLNYENAHRILRAYLSESLTTSVLRAAIDLSFERTGALLCIPDRRTVVPQMVPDHKDTGRPNKLLRESLKGLTIKRWEQRQVITAAAGTDGATVFARNGDLIDIACMIARPPPKTLRRVTGTSEPKTFSGARSTAAWNASIYGLSIKVSEDGPITVYRHGAEIYQLGGGGR